MAFAMKQCEDNGIKHEKLRTLKRSDDSDRIG